MNALKHLRDLVVGRRRPRERTLPQCYFPLRC